MDLSPNYALCDTTEMKNINCNNSLCIIMGYTSDYIFYGISLPSPVSIKVDFLKR